LVGEDLQLLEILGRLRPQQPVKIGAVRPEEIFHLARPLRLIIHVRVVQVLPHLVLEEPRQLA